LQPSQPSPYAGLPPQTQITPSNSQPQLSIPTSHNSQQQLPPPSQPVLEPKSTPFSSLSQPSGQPGSEEDFRLRKNFSVIGGVKKAKSQHTHPMQLVSVEPGRNGVGGFFFFLLVCLFVCLLAILWFAHQLGNITREYPHLARGSFGIVYKGRMVGRNEKIVIKVCGG
jgi:hypothetical protein